MNQWFISFHPYNRAAMRPQYHRKASHKSHAQEKAYRCQNPLPVPRFTARGSEPATGATAPACPWVPCVAVVQCHVRRMGASCLSLSFHAVGKAYSPTGTQGSQGWRPAFIRPYAGACISISACRLTDKKTGTSGISVLYLFYLRFPKKGGWGTGSPSHSCKMHREKREQRKKRKSLYLLHLGAQAGNTHLRFERHRQEWVWKWD